MCSDALEDEPECVPLLVMRARAHIALRRDLDAQADLRDIIRLEPQCALAYRLLGELAARRDENESAAIFFRETIRLDPTDREAADWLLVVEAALRPAAGAVRRSPAVAVAVARVAVAPRAEPPRFARGTYTPDDDGHEGPTQRYGRALERSGDNELWRTPSPTPATLAAPPVKTTTTMHGRPLAPEPAKAAPRLEPPARSSRSTMRGTPELPGFGEYLVAAGILTRERLRAAQAYQRSMKVQLSTAIVTLGLATPQRIEWAAVAHQSQVGRERLG